MDVALAWGTMAVRQHPGSDGCPLVFLHGTGCSNADWDGVIARLPPAQPWLACEFRAHGASTVPDQPFTIGDLADDVIAGLAAAGLTRVVLVGHSLGGMVALIVAQRSAAVRGLLLLEGWTQLGTGRAFAGQRFFGALPPMEIARIQADAQMTRTKFTPAHWQHFWSSVEAADALPYLQQAAIPILAAYGAMGRQPETAAQLLVPARPNIQWRWAPGAGHYLPLEAPALVADWCREVVALAG